ncbi:RluA family pseudouridine synthase [Streptobacillus moniliformis]|uniref:Pseudouridine synthase n=1 Tax=Streptobacillus moniliformis (strain ATCC 14647 / DSM 12112 / NCTC 10651 / 9901) TaxID=519441 RepID=D1AV01_STRM9|nr:RluA family pseudouridine synthase [Streptobacillus moniliformis]ACZ01561.1 pseudouridine synthase, RluA family [Streptobacillus moniliformis DSM 12112]SQA13271.1 Ribosomal large subunit pseudouridine synthase D [Streptobacillus moniliformis]
MLVEDIGSNLERIDIYLSKKLDETRSRIQELIKSNNILVNGKKTKASYKVNFGDEIFIDIPLLKEVDIIPQDIDIDIVYEDKYLAIINKYAGMVVHPSKGHEEDTLVNAIMYKIKDLSGINGDLRPGIVHRLDKNTSGLIIIAKDDKTHFKLSEMFKNKEIKKIYYAIVKGKVNKKSGRIETMIGRNPNDRKKMAVVDNGKLAITNFEVIDSNEKFSLLKVDLETGRTHQIRVHLSHFFFPILGDSVYGRKDEYDRQMLHAYMLNFIHPITLEKIDVIGNFHSDFLRALSNTKLRIK